MQSRALDGIHVQPSALSSYPFPRSLHISYVQHPFRYVSVTLNEQLGLHRTPVIKLAKSHDREFGLANRLGKRR